MPATPQDHKTAGVFVWASSDSVKISLPSMSSLKAGTVRKYRKLPEVDFMFSILEDMADPDELDKIDELSTTDLNALFSAWQADEDGASFPQS